MISFDDVVEYVVIGILFIWGIIKALFVHALVCGVIAFIISIPIKLIFNLIFSKVAIEILFNTPTLGFWKSFGLSFIILLLVTAKDFSLSE